MKKVHMMASWEEVKAVADPLRLRILEALGRQAMTTKQVATTFGEKPTRLYHHVDILERVGLIRLVETRKNRGTVEKYYKALAPGLAIDRKLLERTKGPKKATRGYESLFLSALEATLEEARKAVAAKLIKAIEEQRNALMYRLQISGTEAEIRSLMNRINQWATELQASGSASGEGQYGLTIAFYPVKARSRKRQIMPTGKPVRFAKK